MEESLRDFFVDCREALHINLGQFCDRNLIYRSDFSNFMKGKDFYTPLYKLSGMKRDILDNIHKFSDFYGKIE